jgi:hypothetical protein
MEVDPPLDVNGLPMTPSISPGQNSDQQDPNQPITVTWAMYEDLMNRLSYSQSYAETLRDKYDELFGMHSELAKRHSAVADQCISLSNLCQELSQQAQRQAQTTPSHAKEPKIADAPNFDGGRKELLPFLTKCRLKFAGQPSQFKTERSKVLYAGARLTGPAFSWFLPLANNWDTNDPEAPPPTELASFKAFADALTVLYGDPNLAATADREIRRLRQLTSVADYSARFEQHRQYLGWNDTAFRDQFYTGLKDETKDEIARSPRPETLDELKKLATRLDSRLQERVLEKRPYSQATSSIRVVPTYASKSFGGTSAPRAAAESPTKTPSQSFAPSTALKTPATSTDGTVPMEIGANGAWQLTAAEKQRRRRLHLCDYCGDAKHDVLSCTAIPKHRAPFPSRFNRQAVMTYDCVAETDSSSENAHPEE